MTDDIAVEIGRLFREGQQRRRVTPLRNISGKLSGSRNGRGFQNDNLCRSVDATSCHWCREKFQHGQMRYPIMDGTTNGWDGPVSICMECFKDADSSNALSDKRLSPRQQRQCEGCGEPVFVSPDIRWRLQFCSTRCYQRQYRKRRHANGGSVINWKPPNKCAACKKPLKTKRHDAKFCSNKCRQ